MNQFGEGEQAKICLEIMQRTGAHLELSLAKDQGLSIMVSGKLDAVMKARKDIVARLQTQVRAPGRLPQEDEARAQGNPASREEPQLRQAQEDSAAHPTDQGSSSRGPLGPTSSPTADEMWSRH